MCLTRLQDIVKQYGGRSDGSLGLKIDKRVRITCLLQSGQQSYLIGPASTDARASTAVGRTTIRADEAAGQTTLSVTAITDTTSDPGTTISMTASDIIGIEQNTGVMFFSTISSTGAGPTVDIGAGLDVAAAAGRSVFWFTSRAQRLPHIESIVLRDSNLNDTPLRVYTDAREYDQGVSNKYADGDPTSVLVEPLRINTRLTLDTQPTDTKKTLVITGWYPGEDMDAAANDLSFPQEAFRFFVWELAYEVHAGYGVQWTQAMENIRREAKATYLNLNPENSVLYFQPGGV